MILKGENMKKYFCSIFMLCAVMVLSGCNSRTLHCTRENVYSDEMNMDQVLDIKFNGETVSNLYTSMKVELGESYVSFKNSLLDSVKNEFKDLEDSKGFKSSYKESDNGFDYEVKINFKKLNDDEKNNISIINYENSYISIRNELEDEGYVCK